MEAVRTKTKPKIKKKHVKETVEYQQSYEQAEEALQLELEVSSNHIENISANPSKEILSDDNDSVADKAEGDSKKEAIQQLNETGVLKNVENAENAMSKKIARLPNSSSHQEDSTLDHFLEQNNKSVENVPISKQELSSMINHLVCNLKVSEKKLYPTVEKVEHDVLVYEPIVRAHTESFMCKTHILANKCFNTFYQDLHDTQKHEFYELLKSFKLARQNVFADQCQFKSLKHSIKQYQDKFWIPVEKTANAEGRCGEGHDFKMKHNYTIKELDMTVMTEVRHLLHKLEALISSDVTLHAYYAQIEKLKIEIYLHDLKQCLRSFVPSLSPTSELLTRLKICINVLFDHQRVPTQDDEFITLTRNWLRDLVAELLQIGDLDHNLFILNHVLRCPSGISHWSSGLVQLPLLPLWSPEMSLFTILDSEEFPHCLTSIFMILNCVPDREVFLKYVTAISSTEVVASDKFVVLDSDGEEMVNKYEFFKEWSEDDILLLLNQIPIYNIFMHAFSISSTDGSYDPARTTESNFLKTIAFSMFFIDLLFCGLKAHKCQKRTRVGAKIGIFISNIVQSISYHWQNFKKTYFSNNYGIQREFDRFIFHVVKAMFSSEKYNTVKFLMTSNFDFVSPKMLWNLLWIFHSSPTDKEEAIYTEKDVDIKLKCESNRLLLRKVLDSCSEEDGVNILNTMKNMAFSVVAEEEYIYCIAQEIFEVAIKSRESREKIFTEGIRLLSSMAENFTFIVTYLLKLLKETDDITVKNCMVLFHENCLLNWIPKSDEIDILSDWLLNHPLSSAKNHLSRIILQKLNWSIQGGEFVLPLELHRKISLLVVEAYFHYDINGNAWSVSKGIEQMLQLYASIRYQNIECDNGFVSWAWELLFSLKLHAMNSPNPQWVKMYDGICDEEDLPDVQQDSWLLKLQSAYEQKLPAACYVVLAMTKVGHSLNYLSKEGLDIVSTLIERKQYAASIQCLYLILPFFAKNYEHLTGNKFCLLKPKPGQYTMANNEHENQFCSLQIEDLSTVLNIQQHIDAEWVAIGKIVGANGLPKYNELSFMHRLLDLLLADQMGMKFSSETVVGTVLSKIKEMIKIQIHQTWKITVELSSPLIKLWIQLLVKLLTSEELSGQQKSRNGVSPIHCLLGVVVKIAFLHSHTRDGLLDQMYTICDPHITSQGNKKQSLWNVVFKNAKFCSPLLSDSLVTSSWFSWCVVASETKQKTIQDIWLSVLNDMAVDSQMTPEEAFKKAMYMFPRSSLTIDCLPIYRWCSQAINTPTNHAVLPLLCQNFFLHYLQRASTSASQVKSVGQRFFQIGSYVSMLKSFELKLKDAENIHYRYAEKLKKENNQKINNSAQVLSSSSSNCSQQDFYGFLASMFQAFRTWLQDPNLHSSSICFPALEPRYQSDKLKLIMQNDQVMWCDLINMKKIEDDVFSKSGLWNGNMNNSSNSGLQLKSVKELKLSWKELNSCQVHPPPSITKENKLPIAEISNKVLLDSNSISRAITQDQIAIYKEAQNFEVKFSELRNTDKKYLGLIPMEYKTEDIEKIIDKACWCKRPIKFKLKIQELIVNNKVRDNIERNRIDFGQLLRQLEKHPTPELCVAAAHMENCVRKLVKEMDTENSKKLKSLQEIGLRLFYDHFVKTEMTVISIANFSPSRHLFSLCIDILGREVITGSENQCIPLSKMLLENPSSAGLASPFFCVNDTSVDTFLSVYDILVNSVKTQSSSCALFVLLSKIKLQNWLVQKSVPFKTRQTLLKKIGDALFYCGPVPEEDLLPVYEVFKKHFSCILLFEFPQHFSDVVTILLNGTESKKIGVDIWFEFFQTLGCSLISENSSLQEVKKSLAKFALNQNLSPEQKQFVSSPPLHSMQITESLRYFQHHFLKVRKGCSESLYSRYKGYANPIAIFLGIMGHSLLKLMIEGFRTNEEKTELLWSLLYGAFQAWIDPWISKNTIEFPWLTEDEDTAKKAFNIFAMCIEFHHTQFPGPICEKQLLSKVWNYYINIYVKPGIRNYSIIVCHSALNTLPWQEFYPSQDDIEGMCQVLQCEIPECRNFLAGITVRIQWLEAMVYIQESKSQNAIRQAVSVLAKLIIHSGWEYSVVKTKSLHKLIKKLEKLSWHLISFDTLGILLDMYCSLCNPINLLQQNEPADISDVYILNFIKVLSGMTPIADMGTPDIKIPELQSKRILFLQKYIGLICRCPSNNLSIRSNEYMPFCSIISILLSEMEVLVIKDFPPSEHLSIAMPLTKEILVMLNLLENPRLQQDVLTSTLAWINSNPRTPLLLPCIKAACASLTNISVAVAIVESCIVSRYSTELQDPTEALLIWNLISTCFNVPVSKEDEFIESCLKQNAYLTLYEYVLRRLTVSTTLKARTFLLHRMVDWCGKFKGIGASETKLFLLWDKVFKLVVHVAEDKNLMDAQRALSAFCHSLTRLGEDREQVGVFAAIGLGKASPFSVNFRFLCRALAAYIFAQMPNNGPLRLTPSAAGYVDSSIQNSGSQKMIGNSSEPHPSQDTLKAIDSLKHVLMSKPYAALKYQVEHSLRYISDPKFCFIESRQLLKDIALQTFPNVSYLHILGS